ncbi:MAG: GspE/PulE family protein [Dethiobacteria bacterium]|jgi:type IV pilus assembly protein PilB
MYLYKTTKKTPGDLLLQAGAINGEQLKAALVEHERNRGSLGEILIQKGFITEEKYLGILEERLKIPRVSLYKHHIAPDTFRLIPLALAQKYNVVPLRKEGDKLTLATADPFNIVALDDISILTGCSVIPVLAAQSEITEVIYHYAALKLKGSGDYPEEKDGRASPGVNVADNHQEKIVEDVLEDAPVVQMVNYLLNHAVSRDASDIHLEPGEKGLRVRLRIDGMLSDFTTYPGDIMLLIISRLKIMAGLDIAERRRPQDGNIQLVLDKKLVNIRISTLPTIYGEKMVLRLLSPDKIIMPIETLGFNIENQKRYLKFLGNAYGMILISGPTGCGKSTTLYSTLHYLNNPAKNIVTVEDPVEYRLDGINQVQINNKIGVTFAGALRTILRQDPNIIMVGEIRDAETAEVATRAALTGHLVFSTLHTNDAPSAVTRLLDMGVENFLLTSSLVGVVAQRLIRINCNKCREEYLPPEEELAFYRDAGGSDIVPVFTRGRGCEDCGYSGFKGRTAIHEVMPVDAEMRRLIMVSSDTEEIRYHAVARGMQTILQDGVHRAAEGVTTLKEVMRVACTNF